MLTPEDKKDIGEIVRKEVGTLRTEVHEQVGSLRTETHEQVGSLRTEMHEQFEELAGAVARGFAGVDKRFEQVDKRFEQADKRMDGLDGKMDHMIARMDLMERDVSFIRQNFVSREEFKDVLARLLLVENRLGIVSGAA